MLNDARVELLRLVNGFQASQALHVAATLGLADLMCAGPRTAKDLAQETKTHPGTLYRLLRALASIGVFHEDEMAGFTLTAVGEFMRSDVPGTHAPMAEMVGRPYYWQAWGDLLHSVKSGTTAFDHVHGSDIWSYRAQHPNETRIFDRAMACGTERFAAAVLQVCDFSRFRHVVDVGGGDGAFLAKVLAAYPQVLGTLFDQPHVATRAANSLRSRFPAGRYQAVGGDFFVGVPEGGDAYLLKWILHDWDDEACVAILQSCRKSMTGSSRLLVAEHVIGPPNTDPEGNFMDLTMLVGPGGRERTRDDFASLFAQSGFRILAIVPTTTPVKLIECELAEIG